MSSASASASQRRTRAAAALVAGFGLALIAGGLPAYADPTPTPGTQTPGPEAPGPTGPDERQLAEALQRDLGITVEEFGRQAEAGEQAAGLDTKLAENPEYFGVVVADGAITVRGRGAAVERAAAEIGAEVSDPGPQAVKPADLADKFRAEVGSDRAYAVRTTAEEVVLEVAEPNREGRAGRTPQEFAAEQGVRIEPLTVVEARADIRGGDRFTASNLSCSWGFAMVTAQADPALLTAGHCANDGMGNIARIPGSGEIIGQLDWQQFGQIATDRGADLSAYATLRPGMNPVGEITGYSNPATAVNDWFDPPIGTPVCAAGSTTQEIRCSHVTELTNFLVAWNGGHRLVSGFSYDALSRPGDSGGSVFSGNRAVGVVSGGSETASYASSMQPAIDRGYRMMLPQPRIDSVSGGRVRGTVPTSAKLPDGTRVRVTMGGQSVDAPVDTTTGAFEFQSLGTGEQRLQTLSNTGRSVYQVWYAELGNPTGGQVCGLSQGGCVRPYAGGLLAWSPTTGWRISRNAILAKWNAVGRESGRLGYPTTHEICGLSGGGCYQMFTGGAIIWSPATGTRTSWGAIRTEWMNRGAENGRLGYPTTDEICGLSGGGCYQLFSGGAVVWSPATGAQPSWGAIRSTWASLGAENGRLGYPTGPEYCGLRDGGCWQPFTGGVVVWSAASGAQPSWGAIRQFWMNAGGENGRYGYPTGGETCTSPGGVLTCVQNYQSGTINWSANRGAF